MVKTYDLPCTDGHKSFYGKAVVLVDTPSGWCFLRSYNTLVCGVSPSGGFRRYWDGYSMTTLRHVNGFRETHGLSPITKAQWLEMDVSPVAL